MDFFTKSLSLYKHVNMGSDLCLQMLNFPDYLILYKETFFFVIIFKKFIYSKKMFVQLWTCDSCKAVSPENMQQVVQKELHKAVWTIYLEEKANIRVICYIFNEWKHFGRQCLLSFRHFFLIVFFSVCIFVF